MYSRKEIHLSSWATAAVTLRMLPHISLVGTDPFSYYVVAAISYICINVKNVQFHIFINASAGERGRRTSVSVCRQQGRDLPQRGFSIVSPTPL